MSATDFLGTYAEGWTKGDVETLLRAAAPSFHFDTPGAAPMQKVEFAAYLAGMRESVAAARGGEIGETFVELTEVVTKVEGDRLTAWGWWAIPGTGMEGAGLIKVGPDGVESERITYYAPPAK